ncbi:MAG: aminotransferase class V-fold PLP-dependent enzyme, partial [Clostridia bacterium]|nr:aminotransferase class V-fold PLP-dependent enzyme [Clostridia bacterium]
ASNVCSAVNPVEDIGSLCRRYGVRFIVDASQSAGHRRIDISKLKADAVCAPFHKGLFGIQGGGFVIFGEGIRHELIPVFVSGGNGMTAFDPSMPDILPERLEAGTLPTPAAVSLIRGIGYINEIGLEEINRREEAVSRRIEDMLSSTKGIAVYGNVSAGGSTILFNAEGLTSYELADRLDRYGICTRAGFHCSPLAHQKLGTGESGAVRLSFSCFNDVREADRFYRALKQIIS